MSYVQHNFPSKKALKEAVALLAAHPDAPDAPALQRRLTIAPTAINPAFDPKDGEAFLEGPHYPAPHRWYAKVLVRDSIVVKVLS
jgi:hypothetical protein